MKSRKNFILVLWLFINLSFWLHGQSLLETDTCISYKDNIPEYFSLGNYINMAQYHQCELLYSDSNFCLFYNKYATNHTSIYYFDIFKKNIVPKGIGLPFIYGSFISNNEIFTINVDKNLNFLLNNKFDLKSDRLKSYDFIRFDAGLKIYNYDIENNSLNYLYRDAKEIAYNCQLDLKSNKISFIKKYELKYNTNQSLRYLYYFYNDSLYFVSIKDNIKFRSVYFFQESYRIVSINSYPILYDRDNDELIVLLTNNLKLHFKYKNLNLVEGNPISAYSDFEYLYLLVREKNAVFLLKHKYDINILRIKRNGIFAKYGKTFKTKPLQKIFNQQVWYKPNPNYFDKMLTEEDKKEIKRLLELEKNNNLNLK